MINVYTKKLKYKRKIYLVTNGKGAISSDGLEDIASKLKADNIELIVLYGCSFNIAWLLERLTLIGAWILMILITASKRKTRTKERQVIFIFTLSCRVD